jgi:hypothetical protein
LTQPIQNWIGSQVEDQDIPQTIISQLVSNHPDYPIGLLALPTTNKNLPGIVAPKHIQRESIMQAHLDIHHQHHRKVHCGLFIIGPRWIRT